MLIAYVQIGVHPGPFVTRRVPYRRAAVPPKQAGRAMPGGKVWTEHTVRHAGRWLRVYGYLRPGLLFHPGDLEILGQLAVLPPGPEQEPLRVQLVDEPAPPVILKARDRIAVTHDITAATQVRAITIQPRTVKIELVGIGRPISVRRTCFTPQELLGDLYALAIKAGALASKVCRK